MVRRKMLFTPSDKLAPDSGDDYVAYVTTSFEPLKGFFGELTIVRTTDGRKLYPFVGASRIGPYPTIDEARGGAAAAAAQFIAVGSFKPGVERCERVISPGCAPRPVAGLFWLRVNVPPRGFNRPGKRRVAGMPLRRSASS